GKYDGKTEDTEEVVDVFLQELERYYSVPTSKVLPPLATTRRVFAYGRPALFRTGLSEYKDRICREAYNIFKKDKDAGIVRLGRMKRQSKNTRHSTDPVPLVPTTAFFEQPSADLTKSNGKGDGCACGMDFCPCK
ncbi:hypothetical protein L9F63_016264, partial [Diploptera punctata]